MAGSEDAGTTPAGGSGDLGRRVRERRLELGLSVEETAERAGMAPGYLDYLERAVASPAPGTLLHLAIALETTTHVLAGGGLARSPGRGPAGEAPVLEELTEEESLRLLGGGGVGRVLLADESGPLALPVNFALVEGDLVFRTASGGAVDRALVAGRELGFEVDRIDDPLAEGWSVLVRGSARAVGDESELARLRESGIEPWAGGERERYVRLTPSRVSGRRIRARR